MKPSRNIDNDFLTLLEKKNQNLIALFKELRTFILDIYPDSNELLYHTHALTSVFSVSEKLGDAFCIIPVYKAHLNLGFNKGTLLSDPHNILTGTGNLIRHIDITIRTDFNNSHVKALIQWSVDFAIENLASPVTIKGKTISKIKKLG